MCHPKFILRSILFYHFYIQIKPIYFTGSVYWPSNPKIILIKPKSAVNIFFTSIIELHLMFNIEPARELGPWRQLEIWFGVRPQFDFEICPASSCGCFYLRSLACQSLFVTCTCILYGSLITRLISPAETHVLSVPPPIRSNLLRENQFCHQILPPLKQYRALSGRVISGIECI